MEIITEADRIRKRHPGCGVEKIYSLLKPSFIGRDRFIEIMMGAGFRLKKPRNYRRTTYGCKHGYPNLIKGLVVSAPSTVWQSDITYIPIGNDFYYVVFIIDVYTKNIVGYKVSKNMRAVANVKALAMALTTHQAPSIHHSDRGSQYIAAEYISMLKSNKTEISMGLKAQDNAYAERINRTIKEEYLDFWKPKDYEQLKTDIKKAVSHYNNERPHDHLNKRSPVAFEHHWRTNQNWENPIITIFDDKNL